jgi:hypothetical protein
MAKELSDAAVGLALAASTAHAALRRRRTVWRSVRDVIESLLLGGLAYAYNPAASHRQRFLRHRQRIWIGRTTLIRLYGARGRSER